jgi:hypothetical protein
VGARTAARIFSSPDVREDFFYCPFLGLVSGSPGAASRSGTRARLLTNKWRGFGVPCRDYQSRLRYAHSSSISNRPDLIAGMVTRGRKGDGVAKRKG